VVPAGTAGIEYRLKAVEDSGDRDLLVDVMIDKLGEDTVADHLIADMYIEATAAAGLSHVEKPPPEVVDEWARRVYVVTGAMNGPIGDLIRQQAPEAVDGIEALVSDATRAIDPAQIIKPDPSLPLPIEVQEAWGVAIGVAPAPDAKPDVKPTTTHTPKPHVTESPTGDTNTPPTTPPPDDGHVKVWRPGRP